MTRQPKEFNPETVDPNLIAWTYNVIDPLKGKSLEECQQYVQDNLLPASILVSNVYGDFNFANVIRSANCLGFGPVYYYGKKKYDKRAATGVYKYTTVSYLADIQQVRDLENEFTFVAIENVNRTGYLHEFDWNTPKKPLLVVGGEADGVAPEILELCKIQLEIKMRGTCRSLNLASAAAIAMSDFSYKYGLK